MLGFASGQPQEMGPPAYSYLPCRLPSAPASSRVASTASAFAPALVLPAPCCAHPLRGAVPSPPPPSAPPWELEALEAGVAGAAAGAVEPWRLACGVVALPALPLAGTSAALGLGLAAPARMSPTGGAAPLLPRIAGLRATSVLALPCMAGLLTAPGVAGRWLAPALVCCGAKLAPLLPPLPLLLPRSSAEWSSGGSKAGAGGTAPPGA